jgi:Flp pilus assembly pilin Flp
MPILGRRSRGCGDEGGSALEYGIVLAIVAALAVALLAAMPGVGTGIAERLGAAACSVTGGDDCGPDEPFVWEGVAENDPGGGGSSQDPNSEIDQEAVDDLVERIQEFNDPGCRWWQRLWCSGPSMHDIFVDLLEMNGAELEAVFTRLTDEEIRTLLHDPLGGPHTGYINALTERLWREMSPEMREELRDILDDPWFGEPSWGWMDEARGKSYEYREMTDGSLWGTSGEPSLTDIRQGSIGDCWWMASMGAIADSDPQLLMDMIEENPNGTYTVTFPDGAEITVTGDFPYDPHDDRWAFARPVGADPAIWPMVLEKAYAVKMGGYEAIEYSFASRGMDAITGGSTTNYLHDDRMLFSDIMPLVADQETIQSAMHEAHEAGDPLVAATYNGSISSDEANEIYQDKGLSHNHQYVISEVRDDGSVVLRDPNNIHRRYTLTAEEFHTAFPLVHVHHPGG